MGSAYSIVLFTVLACTSVATSGPEVKYCSDVTGNVNHAIIDEVKIEVPGLVYDESYFPLAQQYGISGKKPESENDYIYLDKEGRKTELPSSKEADAICSDVTEAVNAVIVGEVQMEVPTLIYNESYFTTAQQYGISRKKPTPENAYIYLDKNGTFDKGMSLLDAARQLMRGVTETTKNALRCRPGYRSYACAAIRCFEKDNTARYILEISCVARFETEVLPAGTAYCSDVTGTVDDVIIAEVKAEVPGLMYSKDYIVLAQKYGIQKEKPQPEGDYIYLDKEGKFAMSVELTDAVRKLIKSVTIETKEALKRSPGIRPYACLAVRCFEKDDTNDYFMRIACVARKATGSS